MAEGRIIARETGWARYRRSGWVAGLSLFIFAGCWAAAEVSPVFYTEPLTRAHAGAEFRTDLRSHGLAGDCDACHGGIALTGPQVLAGFPARVNDDRCFTCHRAELEKQDAFGNPGRRRRPAHGGEPGWVKPSPAGLRSIEGGMIRVPLECADCHPDHQGAGFTQYRQVTLSDGKVERRLVVQDACVRCHVHAEPAAAVVRQAFVRGHNGKESFAPDPLPEGAPAAEILGAMARKRVLCITCHAEHRVADGDKFDKPE